MNEKLFDALEICLQALENGETVDSALKRFPALADDLRPLLETSLQARTLAGAAIPGDAQRRGRARLLQQAAEMREAKRAPRRRTWVFSLRPLVVTLILVVFLLSGTGLVRASNGALPGDNLYPVKRTWEDVTLALASNPQNRNQLELTYETERVDEVDELLARGRAENVSFSGYVSVQTNGQWTVAGVPVAISNTTQLPANPVAVGAAVLVTGVTDSRGYLVAHVIETVTPGAVVPEIEDGHQNQTGGGNENGNENGGANSNEGEGGSGEGGAGTGVSSGNESVQPQATKNPSSKLSGVVKTIDGSVWTVNDQIVDVSKAEIVGSAAPGASVTVEGYYNAQGVFVATKVTFGSEGGDKNQNSNGSDGSSTNENRNSNDGSEGGGTEPGDDAPSVIQ